MLVMKTVFMTMMSDVDVTQLPTKVHGCNPRPRKLQPMTSVLPFPIDGVHIRSIRDEWPVITFSVTILERRLGFGIAAG